MFLIFQYYHFTLLLNYYDKNNCDKTCLLDTWNNLLPRWSPETTDSNQLPQNSFWGLNRETDDSRFVLNLTPRVRTSFGCKKSPFLWSKASQEIQRNADFQMFLGTVTETHKETQKYKLLAVPALKVTDRYCCQAMTCLFTSFQIPFLGKELYLP